MLFPLYAGYAFTCLLCILPGLYASLVVRNFVCHLDAFLIFVSRNFLSFVWIAAFCRTFFLSVGLHVSAGEWFDAVFDLRIIFLEFVQPEPNCCCDCVRPKNDVWSRVWREKDFGHMFDLRKCSDVFDLRKSWSCVRPDWTISVGPVLDLRMFLVVVCSTWERYWLCSPWECFWSCVRPESEKKDLKQQWIKLFEAILSILGDCWEKFIYAPLPKRLMEEFPASKCTYN